MKIFNIDLEAFGSVLANMGDEEQALFFKGLTSEFNTWESNHMVQMQLLSAFKLLNPKHRETLIKAFSVLSCEGMNDNTTM